jgi:hypothetical protein
VRQHPSEAGTAPILPQSPYCCSSGSAFVEVGYSDGNASGLPCAKLVNGYFDGNKGRQVTRSMTYVVHD